MKRPFQVGDEVAVFDGWGEVYRVGTIVRVMARWVEADDGSKWRLDGGLYPRSGYSRIRIVHLSDDHRVAIRRRTALDRIDGVFVHRRQRVAQLPVSTLEQIAALLSAEEQSE